MEILDELIRSINEQLSQIQSLFGEYQNSYFPERSPEFFCLELNGEAGELANAEKKRWKGRHVEDEVYSEEAADVFIALINYSNSRGIDLSKAVKKKLEKIEKKRKELEKEGKDY